MSPFALSLHFLQAQPDSRLIALAREGHEPAFEALVRRYRKELVAYCRRLQPRSGGAEDAVQQTFLQAWRALLAGAEVREARPWLYRIAHNVSVNQLRVTVALQQPVAEATGGADVQQLVEQRLQARAALAGIASLPALQRDVFVSTTLNGASHEEVATTLGLSSGAVRGLIYRARAAVRSAAAALTPSPALHWAIRRTETRTGATRAISEAVAGGGGAGLAAAVTKGGAVLTIAGAVAGAGGLITAHTSSHHRRRDARVAASYLRAQAGPTRVSVVPTGSGRDGPPNDGQAADAGRSGSHPHLPGWRGAGELGRGSGPSSEDHGRPSASGERADGSEGGSGSSPSIGSNTGAGGGSPGATASNDGTSAGSSGGPSGGSDGGSTSGTTASSDGMSSSGDLSGGSDGGSSISSASSTSTTSGPAAAGSTASGPGGGTSDGSGSQLTTSTTTLTPTSSDGAPGLDGGSTSSSGSGQTTTTSSN